MEQEQEQSSGGRRKSKRSPPYALFNLLVIIVAIAYGVYHQMYLANESESPESTADVQELDDELKIPLFTAEKLEKFNGVSDSKLYLSILGEVFDVTRGEKHYGPGASYNAFIGKDISRAFVTGEFDTKSTKDSLDHVLSLSPSELVSLKKWRDFYAENYEFVGRLIGRFYEETGEPTEYFWQIDRKIQFGLKQQEEEQQFKHDFPPCNLEFKAGTGSTRYWCTKQSGGVDRDWAGYPIQLFDQEAKTFSCVCSKKENFDLPHLRPYENCEDASRSCWVQTDEAIDADD